MKESLIILGAGVMQGPAIKIAKELGFYAIALDANPYAPCVSQADRFEQIDLKDKEKIEAFARSLQNSYGRVGIMTAGTDFSASVAWTAERLGLPGLPYEAALNASDKARMRACFKKEGVPSPDFAIITEADGLENAPLPFPLVVKPVDNMGSRGCRRVDGVEEFQKAAEDALRFSRSGRVIVETYMEGPEFSVDAIVYHGKIAICGLADRHIFFPPYFVEMGHTMPSMIETEKQEAMLETFCKGVRALGLAGEESVGAAKGDIKLTPDGPMIGEIAARLSGGYMSGWTYPYSSGAEPVRAAILMAMGREPDCLAPVKNWTSAERAFISIPGTVKSIIGTGEAEKQPYVKNLFLRVTEGSAVTFPENNVTKCGNVIAAAPDRGEAVQAAEAAARSILIRLDPADKATAAFLSNARNDGASFPPSAFQISGEMKKALSQILEFPPPCDASKASIAPFPALASSGLKDYAGRTIGENLDAVRLLTGFSLPESFENAENKEMLGRSFWEALIRGSYQGAVYYMDNLRKQ
ncbi:MAG: ATP-grasp domain-containing protein [Treponema sp.]|jgi:biotin carboxylase|nr:ATP-grasp domain-containing protein [Treponema sp.]